MAAAKGATLALLFAPEAGKELRAKDEFSHRVVNDDVERAANELAGIVRSALDP